MISESPSLFGWSLSEPRRAGIESFFGRYTASVTFYGSSKTALRDGLAGLVDPGGNVLLPAYLPDAVVEPFHELGLEARYYRLEENLAPDLADIERRIDEETAAIMSVNYFGFPQPGLREFTALVDEYDCYHIDDNAHAPLSVDNGTLLGTRGDIGVTSLWKLLPIPNGAILYCNDDAIAEAFEPSSLAGIDDQLRLADYRFICKSLLTDLLDRNATIRQSVDDFVAGQSGGTAGPHARYENGKGSMSKLSAYVIDDADPISIRSTRRDNYRAWQRIFDGRSNVDVLYESLPPGICPQVFPIRVSTPQRLLAELEARGVGGAHTWPRLPSTVRENSAYDVTTRLAREIVVLPVHQDLESSSIDAVGERLEW
ncbi:DegT/DnrJ/EryC1/StrS family aminotransferase [Natronorubrum tibetense]|uniref:DegT/DnrJ/EryC1/StrS aminotransferase n=1 Tax=Natronorubrum tibetense GA33 TaxID=1114856 RepID=L9VQ58_9EURY|nr:DegT/DnrJ/EryC1/StrS family aminotransferase [Natronorubrum tibetense]ELY39107.1 DegT/DnrJ/EryC1/StrS aminotransferase [Natronorubrum tibetense GA33]